MRYDEKSIVEFSFIGLPIRAVSIKSGPMLIVDDVVKIAKMAGGEERRLGWLPPSFTATLDLPGYELTAVCSTGACAIMVSLCPNNLMCSQFLEWVENVFRPTAARAWAADFDPGHRGKIYAIVKQRGSINFSKLTQLTREMTTKERADVVKQLQSEGLVRVHVDRETSGRPATMVTYVHRSAPLPADIQSFIDMNKPAPVVDNPSTIGVGVAI